LTASVFISGRICVLNLKENRTAPPDVNQPVLAKADRNWH
jgi:hypothetical protein